MLNWVMQQWLYTIVYVYAGNCHCFWKCIIIVICGATVAKAALTSKWF